MSPSRFEFWNISKFNWAIFLKWLNSLIKSFKFSLNDLMRGAVAASCVSRIQSYDAFFNCRIISYWRSSHIARSSSLAVIFQLVIFQLKYFNWKLKLDEYQPSSFRLNWQIVTKFDFESFPTLVSDNDSRFRIGY